MPETTTYRHPHSSGLEGASRVREPVQAIFSEGKVFVPKGNFVPPRPFLKWAGGKGR